MSITSKKQKKVKVAVKAKKKVTKPVKKTTPGLSAAALKKLEKQLNGKLELFVKTLARHERKTTALLPADAPEAINIKQEMEVTEKLETHEADTIRLIQGALRRLRAGTYGKCSACRKPIPAQRLTAQPWSLYCVPCKSARE